MAVPQDGKPVSKFANHHDAFLEIIQAIKTAVKATPRKPPSNIIEHPAYAAPSPVLAQQTVSSSKPRSSNMRIKKKYSERDRDEFLDESFEFMASYFEESLRELQRRNDSIACKFKRIDTNHFTAVVYEDDVNISECKIWIGGFLSGINLSSTISSSDNSFNESMTVQVEDYSLSLSHTGMSSMMMTGQKDSRLSQQGAAEYYWDMLIRKLQ